MLIICQCARSIDTELTVLNSVIVITEDVLRTANVYRDVHPDGRRTLTQTFAKQVRQTSG